MHKFFVIGLICFMAACGADGDPLKPKAAVEVDPVGGSVSL